MTTENHDGQPKVDDNIALTPADSPVNSIPGDITEIEYESALEATRAERAQQAREAEWEADQDWQAFRNLCYSDTEVLDAAAIRKGVNHLVTAARNGHALAHNAVWRRNCTWEKDGWVLSRILAKQRPGIGQQRSKATRLRFNAW